MCYIEFGEPQIPVFLVLKRKTNFDPNNKQVKSNKV